MNTVLVICGATATGKTKLAVNCALKLNTEIISADSQLIYKGLDIGTAKPTKEEMCGVKHHMIDTVNPECNFSVAEYRETARPVLDNLIKEGKTPVICGGTGFYINSLLFDLSYGSVGAEQEVRDKYSKILEKEGKEFLYSLLKKIDPDTADKLHVNDVKRIIRALEIFEVSGKKKSEIADTLIPRYNYVSVAIDYNREELYERINARVDDMINGGLVEEVNGLYRNGIDERFQCMQAIGYKEVLEYLKNSYNFSTMCDIIKQNTRHYAKRQLTFFRKLENTVWLKPEEATAEKVTELLNEYN